METKPYNPVQAREDFLERHNWFMRLLIDSPGLWDYSLYGTLRHPLDCLIFIPYRRTKYFIQRGWRGYSDQDAWNLGYYLNLWMPEAVRSLKGGHGVPAQFVDKDQPNEADFAKYRAQWDRVLEQIAMGFEASKQMDEEMPMPGTEHHFELMFRINIGMMLFSEYKDSLWD